jgi:hypothetical protein
MSDAFKTMMDKYNATHVQKTTGKKYDLKNYFSTWMPDDVKSAKKRIRVLPIDGKEEFWDEKFAHKLKVGKKYPTYACLKEEEGKDCPFCEAYSELYDTDKEIAKNYSKRKFYIIKVIDRDNEQDGPKFWRISHSYKKNGRLDQLMSIMEDAGHDMTHPETGRDFKISLVRDGQGKITLQSITPDLNESKLSEDEDKAREWLSDNRTWRDVYAVKDYNFLAIIVLGETPVYDKEKEMYVSLEQREADKANAHKNAEAELNAVDSELSIGGETTTEETKPLNTNESITNTNTDSSLEDDGDDLPF